jgi:hypothetical protein
MKFRPKFWRWVQLFGALGLVVPAITLSRWLLFHLGEGVWEGRLWPSSFVLMALDTPKPSPVGTVIYVYALTLLSNMALYAAIGALLWPMAYLAVRLFGIGRQPAKSG